MAPKIETITPAKAQEMLNSSYGNRPIKQGVVLEYAVVMDAGKWSPTAAKIDIDEANRLINGHHRLAAIVLCQKPIDMYVDRNVPKSDREVIDTGATRTLNDITSMYTRRENVSTYNACLNTCAQLVVHGMFSRPKIKTLDIAQKWAVLFEPHIDYVVSEARKGDTSTQKPFMRAAVTGPFAFAMKRNPTEIKRFMKQVFLGESIDRNMPAYTIRNAIMGADAGTLRGKTQLDMPMKILQACLAFIKGTSYKTAARGQEGHDYFLQAYDNAQVESLLKPYLKFTKGREELIAKMAEEIMARGK